MLSGKSNSQISAFFFPWKSPTTYPSFDLVWGFWMGTKFSIEKWHNVIYDFDPNLTLFLSYVSPHLGAWAFLISFNSYEIRGRSQTTFTKFGFFWPPTPLRLHFLWYESLQKVDFFDHLPPSSCKRSLWMAPNRMLL